MKHVDMFNLWEAGIDDYYFILLFIQLAIFGNRRFQVVSKHGPGFSVQSCQVTNCGIKCAMNNHDILLALHLTLSLSLFFFPFFFRSFLWLRRRRRYRCWMDVVMHRRRWRWFQSDSDVALKRVILRYGVSKCGEQFVVYLNRNVFRSC